jgi:hypothetical protein
MPENIQSCAKNVEKSVQGKNIMPNVSELPPYTWCNDHNICSSWLNILSLKLNAIGIFSPTPSPRGKSADF